MEIHIHRDGQHYGPYSVEQTREYLASGGLFPNDLAWHEGADGWTPLGQIAAVTPTATAVITSAGTPNWVPARRDDASPAASGVPAQLPWATPSSPVPQPRPTSSRSSSDSSSGNRRRIKSKSLSSSNQYGKQQRDIGAKNMVLGGLILIIGLAITIGSYEAAASTHGGGSYVLAWGAILFGGIRFVAGMAQYFKG